MKILAISDTHGFHKQLTVPKDIDMIIYAGDCSNNRSPDINSNEVLNFLDWFGDIPVKYKIMIAGNHDTSIECKLIRPSEYIESIIYLEHESITIEGINIFGSPYTPSFNNWSFMKKRGKLNLYWQQIPENTDILVTHGPPKSILDLSYSKEDILEYCGDKELYNHVLRVEPAFHIFGHIHDFKDCHNSGNKTIEGLRTKFMNVSAVEDRKFDAGLKYKGQIFEI